MNYSDIIGGCIYAATVWTGGRTHLGRSNPNHCTAWGMIGRKDICINNNSVKDTRNYPRSCIYLCLSRNGMAMWAGFLCSFHTHKHSSIMPLNLIALCVPLISYLLCHTQYPWELYIYIDSILNGYEHNAMHTDIVFRWKGETSPSEN